MALADYEGSIDRGQQVELYQFVYGEAGQEYLYTDGETPVVHDGKTYNPLPIERDKVGSKGDLSGREVKVVVPRTSEIADLFRIFPPGRVVSVVIKQGHVRNPDDPVAFDAGDNFIPVWTGRVLESTRVDMSTTLTCEALSAGMRRPGLRRHYQWGCSLALYGPQCQAVKTAVPSSATAIAGNKITLQAGWEGTFAPAKFIGGLFEWQGASGTESRGILRVEGGNTVVISGPPIGLTVNAEVNVFLGCAHTTTDCTELFGNILNFGGHPWIPTAGNPINKNNHS